LSSTPAPSGPPPPEPPAGRVLGLRHAGITVRDLDVSLRFYRDALGLEVTVRRDSTGPHLAGVTGMPVDRLRKANLALPGTAIDLELLQWGGLERRSGASRPCDWGSGHVCLYVDGLDGLLADLRAAGHARDAGEPHAFLEGPNAGARVLYVTDPDGYVIELYEAASQAP